MQMSIHVDFSVHSHADYKQNSKPRMQEHSNNFLFSSLRADVFSPIHIIRIECRRLVNAKTHDQFCILNTDRLISKFANEHQDC